MNCLCCAKPLTANETSAQWHGQCIRRFFGTKEMPCVQVTEALLEQLATESTNKGFTVPGVQKKLSLHLSEEEIPRLTLVNYPTGYILKPQTDEYAALPESEFLVMQMAKKSGIRTVEFALLRMNADENTLAYITKRADRVFDRRNHCVHMLAMEDFCQLEGRLTQDKYKGSYERCAKVIESFSNRKMLDLTELFLRMVFSFVTGNSDMHLKNFSLIEENEDGGTYCLSAAYDLLPVNVILPEDKDQFALTINGKKRNIRKKDFLIFAQTIGLPEKAAEKIIQKIVSMQAQYLQMCDESYLPQELKESFRQLICERMQVLQ